MSYITTRYSKAEIEQKIKDIKRTLERDISSFERYILEDMLKKCEAALSEPEGGAANE